ncbi:MAG: HAMP domain-containing protein [Alphaproteobacteria bacterium]|nr:HAMP domain-containing protein [Alphaproteobacteria bacterium]
MSAFGRGQARSVVKGEEADSRSKAAPSKKARSPWRTLPGWATSNTFAAAALSGAAAIAFLTTWVLLSPAVEHINRGLLTGMVIANGVIAATFIAVVGLRLWHVWSDRRHELAGSQTHLDLARMFAFVAVVPSIIAFLFAFSILRTSLDDVFSARIDKYVTTAREFANTYFQDEANDAGVNLKQIALDIVQDQLVGLSPDMSPIRYRQRLEEQAYARNLAALVVLDGKRRIIARVELVKAAYDLPPAAIFDKVDEAVAGGAPRSEWGNFDLNDEEKIDLYRGLLKIDSYDGGYLVSYKIVPPAISQRLRAVRNMRDQWNSVKQGRSRIERVFLTGYIVLAIIILCGAVWLALWAATRIVNPIRRLVGMADRVSAGDLGARVEVYKGDGELGALARSMNHMTAQLQTQRDDLVETNKQFDRRRRFTEAVLSGVSAGVIGVNSEGRITIANRFAAELLGLDAGRLVGSQIAAVIPELQGAFSEAAQNGHADYADQIEIERAGGARTVNVRIVSDEVDGERSFVITFDDITQLISAQRNAAWGDVARRIAHEIKNPLTPIQLSAERLRRKYLKEIQTTPEIFDKCTETIIRHVGDIGRMVDEFSSFARMPKPVMAREDLRELVKAAIFPQRVALPDVDFKLEAPSEPVWVECDGRLIIQALSNLIKNAGESIGARIANGDGVKGAVALAISMKNSEARVDVIDNGVGLPKAERHRLTEPYMTTRAKGTGLGLAIVQKVIEDHGGALKFEDDATLGPNGARVSIILPKLKTVAGAAPARAAAE